MLSVSLTANAASPASAIKLNPATAAPAQLELDGRAVPLAAGHGGFVIRDFNAGRDVALRAGKIAPEGKGTKFTAEGDDLTLQATFTPRDGCVMVAGEIATTRTAERAVIVRYVLPVPTDGAVFENSLSESKSIKEGTEQLGAIFPIAAMTGRDWGAALSIPPTSPCCFGMVGSERGLAVEFYLGLSPLVKTFPNRAAFSFVIDTAQPGWGFRGALARYYGRYPEFYTSRITQFGFWNWNDPIGLNPPDKSVEEALSLYSIHGLTHGQNFADQVARDRRLGVLSFAYTIVGQRELTGLPKLSANYDDAMAVYHDFAKAWQAEGTDGPLHRKFAKFNERNRDLPEQIENSTVGDAGGHLRLRARKTVWGGNSITFVENPNPHLFEDQGKVTVGSVTLAMLTDWMAHDPAPGVHLDSLGSQWPSCLNYRKDHFAYAQYPLTFDPKGRVALHNRISHYEFVEQVDAVARKYHKLVFGNGIDIYRKRRMEEHYNSRDNGRFFLAAQLDVAGREIEHDVLTRERLDAFRTCLGPKLMTAVLYQWKDQDDVKVDMNRALAYDIFAAPNRFFRDKISYIGAADGYARDRDFLQWFIKNARMLHVAGWEPVTYAKVDQPDVVCERYGEGDVFYFALVNLGSAPVDCTLTIDMGALNISSEGGEMSYFAEVARKTPLKVETEGDEGRVRLRLNPNETNIVKLSRAW